MAAKFLPWTRNFFCSTVTMELPGPFNDFVLRVQTDFKLMQKYHVLHILSQEGLQTL